LPGFADEFRYRSGADLRANYQTLFVFDPAKNGSY
jgi:hypothetical protein